MQLLGEGWLAGVVAALQLVGLPPARRSQALGAFYMLASFFGCLNLVLIGNAVDEDEGNLAKLRPTMITAVSLPYFAALVLFTAAAHFVSQGRSASPTQKHSTERERESARDAHDDDAGTLVSQKAHTQSASLSLSRPTESRAVVVKRGPFSGADEERWEFYPGPPKNLCAPPRDTQAPKPSPPHSPVFERTETKPLLQEERGLRAEKANTV